MMISAKLYSLLKWYALGRAIVPALHSLQKKKYQVITAKQFSSILKEVYTDAVKQQLQGEVTLLHAISEQKANEVHVRQPPRDSQAMGQRIRNYATTIEIEDLPDPKEASIIPQNLKSYQDDWVRLENRGRYGN